MERSILFDNLILERLGVNDTVIKYTSQIISEIKNNFGKSEITMDLVSSNDLKLRNFIIKIKYIENKDYANIKLSDKLIDNNFLDDVILYLEFSNIDNILESNVNHELNHALEFYKRLKNNVKLNKSWYLQEKLNEHKKFAINNDIWKDFTYLIYLTLKHETNSHVSEIYSDLKNSENIDIDILKSKNYKDCLFYLNYFKIDVFYKRFIKKYTDEDFIKLTENFCENFNFKKPNNLEQSITVIDDVIKKLNKKIRNYKNKMEKVVFRIKTERSKDAQIIETTMFKHVIDYDSYID